MYGIKPKNYDTFKCIADKCTDTCCIGWLVLVDATSYKRYEKDPYLIQNIIKIISKSSNTHAIKMDSNNRCTFLNENGLCNMVINRDENYLCDTCQNYPRVKTLYGGNIFFTLTFSCEAVVSHLLKNEDDLAFDILELKNTPDVDDRYWIAKNKFTYETNFEIFNTSMAILQNKEHRLYEKISFLYMMYQNIDELEKSTDQSINDLNVDNILSQYLDNLNNTEIFDVIKNVKLNDTLFNKGGIIKNLDNVLSEIRDLLRSENPTTAAKIKTAKNLSDFSDEEIATYNQKVATFIGNNELRLSKYLILLMVEYTFPSNFEKLKDAMSYILIRIFIIQSTIISLNIGIEEEITEDIFFESLRITSKAFEHNKNNSKLLSEYVVNDCPNFKVLMNIIL